MAVSAAGKTPNYDPNNFDDPDFSKDKDGYFAPTDYQAARALKAFMRQHDMLFFSADQMWEAINNGTVTHNGKTIEVDDKQKAMFDKLNKGLFIRLDAGTDGTHDKWVGIKDIDDAVKQSWKLHGAEKPDKGHWKDPATTTTMTNAEAKEIIQKWRENKGPQRFDGDLIEQILNFQSYRTIDRSTGQIDRHMIDDPRLLEAVRVIQRNWNEINTDFDKDMINPEELDNWKV